jgi:DNA-binding MarR family transcriptional regulator
MVCSSKEVPAVDSNAKAQARGSQKEYGNLLFQAISIVIRYTKEDALSMMLEHDDIQLLAKFRREIRRFLQFSEQAAASAGLQPQQHQLLLQVVGAPDGTLITIGYIADVMGLRHHTVVELSKRCELAGLVSRTHDPNDHRRVMLEVTALGNRALRRLSDVHSQQLRELAPSLIQALTRVRNSKP